MEKLNQNRDFQRIFSKGKSSVTPLLVVYASKTRRTPRFAVVAGKKVGNAVLRNRAKRVLRAAFLEISKTNRVSQSFDLIFVARAKTPHVKMQIVMQDMLSCMRKLGVL